MGKSYKGKVAFLGCGEYPMQDAVNVDIRKLDGVDVVSDARTLPFKDNELKGIASRNLIEHFSRADIKPMLKEWVRCISRGGFVQVETVDMGELMDNWRNIPEENMLDGILGAQTYDENFHKMVFTKDMLDRYFTEAGLQVVEIRQFEHREIPRIIIIGQKL